VLSRVAVDMRGNWRRERERHSGNEGPVGNTVSLTIRVGRTGAGD
jgi:hypothetical protein